MSDGDEHSLLGRTLGNRYVMERVLGKGAMGTVYCARQLDRGGVVAIKILHPRLVTDAGLVERFKREAFATSRLDHPNALRVLDFGADDNLFYLVTEYVEAEDLLSVMEAQWPLSDERIVAILSQVLSALIAVHEVGIVHRDLKPENILVLADKNDNGAKVDVVKVCDFGIAKVARSSAVPRSRSFAPRLTAEGVVVGTPDYMSPEQARGHAVDGRSDLYSVGVVLYQLLAGRTPFEADNVVDIALKHVSEEPVPPSHYRNAHPALEAVCLRALSKRPTDRFQTAGEMRKALRDALKLDSMALALVPAATPVQLGSTFSTSRPAVLSARQAIVRFGLFRESQPRPLAFGYAALVLVVATASALSAARQTDAPESLPKVDEVHASTAIVSPPSLGVPLDPPVSDTSAEKEPVPTTDEAPPVPPRTEEPPTIEPQRLAERGRQVIAKGALPSAVGAAAPVSSVSPVSHGALLIRRDPWSRATNAPVSRNSGAAVPRSGDPPEPATPVQPPPPLSVPSTVETNRASVTVTSVVTSAGISGAKVRVGLSHMPLLTCYERSLRVRPSAAPLDTELRLSIDVGGRVVSAILSRDGDLPGLRACVESAVRGMRIRDVDTGDGLATVRLTFRR